MTDFIYSNASEEEKEAYKAGANHNKHASQETKMLLKSMEEKLITKIDGLKDLMLSKFEDIGESRKVMMDDLGCLKEDVKEGEGRITRLETWKGIIIGGIGVLTVLVIPILIFIIQVWLGRHI